MSRWKVELLIDVPEEAREEQVEEFASYHVQECGSLGPPMTSWEWKPVDFSVRVEPED